MLRLVLAGLLAVVVASSARAVEFSAAIEGSPIPDPPFTGSDVVPLVRGGEAYRMPVTTITGLSMNLTASNATLPTALTNLGLGTASSPVFTGATLSGMTAGSVLFAGTAGVLSQDNAGLFWDNTNNRLAVGNIIPAVTLDVGATSAALRVRNLFTDASNGEWFEAAWSGNVLTLGTNKNGAGIVRPIIAAGAWTFNSNTSLSQADADTTFSVTNSSSTGDHYPAMKILNYAGTSTGSAPLLQFINSRGSLASPTATQNNDILGAFGAWGQYSTTPGQFQQSSSIRFTAAGNFSGSSTPSYMSFYTTPVGAFSMSERVRIDPNGLINFGLVAGAPSHIASAQATAPALTSCGTGSPSIVGSDTAGTVTMGTTASGCVITFNVAYTGAPHCNVSWRSTPLASQSYAVGTAAITLTQTATSGNKVDYVCIAPSGG